MPWAKMTYNRIQTIYAELFDKVFVKSRNSELIAKDALIRAEILKRDFTKRQLTILTFIETFSFPYGKESAIIPKLKDFEVAGISATKVKDELTKLIDLNVITWERGKDTNEFWINDPREWKANYHSTYNDIRSRELFFLNLRHAGVTFDLDALMQKAIPEEERRQT
jgi:hypothetical protein